MMRESKVIVVVVIETVKLCRVKRAQLKRRLVVTGPSEASFLPKERDMKHVEC